MGATVHYVSEEVWAILSDILTPGNGVLIVPPEAQKKIASYDRDQEVNGFDDPDYDYGGQPDVLVDVLSAHELPDTLEDAATAIKESGLAFQARPVFRALGIVPDDD